MLKKYKIPDSLNYGDKNKKIEIENKDIKLIKSTFEKKKLFKIDNLYEFNKIHISMIKNIAPIIKSKETRNGKNKIMHYEYDNDIINKNKQLAEFRKNKKEECVF